MKTPLRIPMAEDAGFLLFLGQSADEICILWDRVRPSVRAIVRGDILTNAELSGLADTAAKLAAQAACLSKQLAHLNPKTRPAKRRRSAH